MQLQPVRVVANFEPAMLDMLDAFRRAQAVIPSRAETIRQAVRALATQPTSIRKSRGKGRKQRDR
jgi:hypothetical protein